MAGHSERAHARLSASGAERWMKCPPSAELEEMLPDKGSQAADEGTFAHELAELELHHYLGMPDTKYYKALKALKQSKFYTPDIIDAVQTYLDFAGERINEAHARSKDAVIEVELLVDFSEWVPGGFGTADLVTISDGMLEVIDLKGGANVAVSAEGNPQVRLYALGALAAFDWVYNLTTIRMSICQPRQDRITTEELTRDVLLTWGAEVVQPIAAMADRGEGELCPGDHCRFCRANVLCRARAERQLELAEYDFADPRLLTDKDIADILGQADELKRWVTNIQKYALDQALAGVTFDGWKLVEGRSVRKYKDETAVAEALTEAGYEPERIYKPQEILGITAMQKLLGKKKFDALLQDCIIKPPGAPALVPESDKRAALKDSAADDFAEK